MGESEDDSEAIGVWRGEKDQGFKGVVRRGL